MGSNQTLVEKFYTQLSASEGEQPAKVMEEIAPQQAPAVSAPPQASAVEKEERSPIPSHVLPVDSDTVGLAGGLVSIIRKKRRKQR